MSIRIDCEGWQKAKAALDPLGRAGTVIGLVSRYLRVPGGLPRTLRAVAARMARESQVRDEVLSRLLSLRSEFTSEVLSDAAEATSDLEINRLFPRIGEHLDSLRSGLSVQAEMRQRYLRRQRVDKLQAALRELGSPGNLKPTVSLAGDARDAVEVSCRQRLDLWIERVSPLAESMSALNRVAATYEPGTHVRWSDKLAEWRDVPLPGWPPAFDGVLADFGDAACTNSSPKDVANDPQVVNFLNAAWSLAEDLCNRYPVNDRAVALGLTGPDRKTSRPWLEAIKTLLRVPESCADAIEPVLWIAGQIATIEGMTAADDPAKDLMPILALLFAAAMSGEWRMDTLDVRNLLDRIQERKPGQKLRHLSKYYESWPSTAGLREFLQFAVALRTEPSEVRQGLDLNTRLDLWSVALTSKVLAFAPHVPHGDNKRWELAKGRLALKPDVWRRHLINRMQRHLDGSVLPPADRPDRERVRNSRVTNALLALLHSPGSLQAEDATATQPPYHVLDEGLHACLYGRPVREALVHALAPRGETGMRWSEVGRQYVMAMFSVPCVDRRDWLSRGEPTPWTLHTLLVALAVDDSEFRNEIYDPLMGCGSFVRDVTRLDPSMGKSLKYLRFE